MSVVPMKRIQVIALRRDRKAVLEYLQVLGAVEISIRRKEDDVFKKRDKSKEQQVFLKNADRAEEALAILKRNVPEKTGLLSSLEGRKELTKADFERLMDQRDEILDVCFDVISLDKQQADIISGIPKLMDQKKALEPWMQFDIPLSMKETEKTAVFIGTLPGKEGFTLSAACSQPKAKAGAQASSSRLRVWRARYHSGQIPARHGAPGRAEPDFAVCPHTVE